MLAAEVRRQPRRSSSPRSSSLSRRFMFAVEVHEASAGRRGSGLAADSCGRTRSFSSPGGSGLAASVLLSAELERGFHNLVCGGGGQ